jgi:hypothetical protein
MIPQYTCRAREGLCIPVVLLLVFDLGFHSDAQAGVQLLGSRDFTASDSQVAGTTGMYHHT